jgi:predicted nucleotidyltransferase
LSAAPFGNLADLNKMRSTRASSKLLTAKQTEALARTARRAGLKFVRLFGSAVCSPATARDIDLAVGLDFRNFASMTKFQDEAAAIFRKPIDLVQLRPGLSPLLLREIGSQSLLLWEAPLGGRECYIELMDRFLAIAHDELLGFPPELRKCSLSATQRMLRVS